MSGQIVKLDHYRKKKTNVHFTTPINKINQENNGKDSDLLGAVEVPPIYIHRFPAPSVNAAYDSILPLLVHGLQL